VFGYGTVVCSGTVLAGIASPVYQASYSGPRGRNALHAAIDANSIGTYLLLSIHNVKTALITICIIKPTIVIGDSFNSKYFILLDIVGQS
jgi:hypothetical protein